MQKLAITVTDVVDNQIVPITNLEQGSFKFVKSSDNSTEIVFIGFYNNGNGNYLFWGFDVPAYETQPNFPETYQVRLKINNVFQDGYGVFNVYRDEREPNGQGVLWGRLDRGISGQDPNAGCDSIFGLINYDAAVTLANLTPFDGSLVHKKWVTDNYQPLVSGGFVTLASAQFISGKKTFSGGNVFDLGASTDKFRLQMNSNPPNGGVIGLDAKYQSSSKMLFDFYSSDIKATNLFIPTTASKYISGTPANNDFVWKKWVVNNFAPLTQTTWSSKTVYIDSNATENISGKIYTTVSAAITELLELEPPTSSTRWTIIVKQPKEGYYDESVSLPEYFNLIGEGQVKITGQFSRAGSLFSAITSKVQGITFESDGSHDVGGVEAVDCVFNSVSDNVVITKSILRNSGLYAGGFITSADNNKIINGFGNKDITWQTHDKVYTYVFDTTDNYLI